MLTALLHDTLDALLQRDRDPVPQLREVGTIASISESIATVTGLPHTQADELLMFRGQVPGIAFNLDADELGVILLGASDHLEVGQRVERTGRVVDVPVGDALLGRVIDPTGRPLDGLGAIAAKERRPIERAAPPFIHRAPVKVPLQTGLKVVDALIPVGRGQRELIVGDRQTGKTAIAVDTILNQHDQDMICIYCAIGQRASAIANVIATLRDRDALDYSLVMMSTGEDPPALQYITPYAATTVAEYFMDQGRDVLVVYDDLTRHAWAYRELSLLLRRPPGREAYPGDIFYIHSRLLERSTRLKPEYGGGSLTALPIVETQAQNLAAYIPTNLISITDGQIYLSPEQFQQGILPAVEVGKSVSRVGGKTQLPAYRDVAGDLRLSYSQYKEMEVFARFGTQLDDDTRHTLARGRRVQEVLKQRQAEPLAAAEQIAVLLALAEGELDGVPLADIQRVTAAIRQAVRWERADLCDQIEAGENLSDRDRAALLAVAAQAVDDAIAAAPSPSSPADSEV
ncbi:alternate F1F0 ATPase, F1 subunit alpha [Leptolyngbya iicbica]|uniref:ATP synthase subunit alpha n=2 Tax=Cyanophyceae TaxID=3028117 RepID=A0A4Q7EFZ4_9CYAN|nr:alternate F1F0 ATPase, F1 subunit alpha [Leptolyngbya sp. LK]RZM82225.1 alternate F1F0 ATPase, F1 subunit alpha [Leptolyngbya sp. LK]